MCVHIPAKRAPDDTLVIFLKKQNANSTYESIITPDNTNDKNNNYLFSRDNYLFINSKELLHNQIAVNNNFDDTFYVRVFTFVSCY